MGDAASSSEMEAQRRLAWPWKDTADELSPPPGRTQPLVIAAGGQAGAGARCGDGVPGTTARTTGDACNNGLPVGRRRISSSIMEAQGGLRPFPGASAAASNGEAGHPTTSEDSKSSGLTEAAAASCTAAESTALGAPPLPQAPLGPSSWPLVWKPPPMLPVGPASASGNTPMSISCSLSFAQRGLCGPLLTW